MVGTNERVVADDMVDALELIARRALASAANDVAYNLKHGLEDEILQIVGGKNIVKTTQELTNNGSKIHTELAFKIQQLIEKEIKTTVRSAKKSHKPVH